ncbi:MAG: deoxyribodipyrimidine photo-lyase, partial [Flavobacteriales bacterium]
SEENISNIQIYIVDFEAFNKVNTSTAIYYKEHPLNNDDQGIEEARDWVFDEKGYYSSFFSFWKKCKKELEC